MDFLNYLTQVKGVNIGENTNQNFFEWDNERQTFTLSGSGNGFGEINESLYFVYSFEVKNIIIAAEVNWPKGQNNCKQQAGIMLRENLTEKSRFIAIGCNACGAVSLIFRLCENTSIKVEPIKRLKNCVLWLERIGHDVKVRLANFGEPLDDIITISFNFEKFYAGLFIYSGTIREKAIVSFKNFRTYYTAKEDFIPYRDYIGSQLEILEIDSGIRRILYCTKEGIEAPNWTKDGKEIIFNSKGLLYRFNLYTKEINPINTAFATSNNNDHGLSPDGKWIAISNHDNLLPQGKNSIIYVLPSDGGIPRKITPLAPSYWHGWSPDGKWLVYTAMRNNCWNIYKISLEGGEEIALTQNEFLNDGPEFSPDGKKIFFNSNRTGRMQIWRMNTDGTEQQQITNDEFQNWFPHPSPDGTKVVFLSYFSEINSWEHPYYKVVMLQIMNSDGTDKRILSYLYGGQGTINVPSWSPDGRMIAFISNSDINENN